jgi:Ala-tRNA(Pro) deacylase
MSTAALRDRVHALLATAGVPYREVEHEPVRDYEAAAHVRERFGLNGVESKNLFLESRDGRSLVFVTVQGKRFNAKAMKRLLGSAVSIAPDAVLTAKTGCEPGCAVPFGYLPEVELVVDDAIFAHQRFIFSPGPPSCTIVIDTACIPAILAVVPNKVVRYVEPEH